MGGGLRHDALVYGDDAEYLAGALPFLRPGVAAGEPVLVVTTPANTALLRDALGAGTSGVTFADSAEWMAAPGRACAAYQEFVAREAVAGARPRVLAEPAWTRRAAPEVREWLRFEASIDAVFAATPLEMACGYDARVSPRWVLEEARRTHVGLLRGADLLPSAAHVGSLQYIDELERGLALPAAPPDAVEVRVEDGLRTLRRVVAERLRAAAVGDDRVDDAVYCANELAANVVEHSGGRGVLRVWTEDGRCLLELHDPAGGRPPPLAGYLPVVPSSAGGQGMTMLRRLADYVQIARSDRGTTFRLTFGAGGPA